MNQSTQQHSKPPLTLPPAFLTQAINMLSNHNYHFKSETPKTTKPDNTGDQPILLYPLLLKIIEQFYRDNLESNHDIYKKIPNPSVMAMASPVDTLFVNVNPSQLTTILTDLLTQANDWICQTDQENRLVVSLSKVSEEAVIEISYRNPPNKRDQTPDRTAQNNAMRFAHHYHGHLTHQITNHCTTIALHLPTMIAPPWFAQAVTLPADADIIVLSENEALYAVSESRITHYPKLTIERASDNINSIPYIRQCTKRFIFFLVDAAINIEQRSGLTLIDELNLGNRSILISDHYQDTQLQQQALALGTRLLPTYLISQIPIILEPTVITGAPSRR